jgi:selenide,water dikinase
MGGIPKTALNLVGYPDDKLGLDWLGEILRGGGERCQASGTAIVGGHTVRDAEIKFGMAVTGVIHPQKIFTNAGARPGDTLVLTKSLGTGFVTTAAKANACPEDLLETACVSMVQLNDIGRDVMIAAGAHAATDVTGFGLAGHALEMADGSQVTLVFSLSQLPIFPGCESLARKPYLTRASVTNAAYVAGALGLEGKPDPIRLEFFYDAQTSGGLLICVPAEQTEALVAAARARGAASTCVVGEVIAKTDKSLIVRN